MTAPRFLIDENLSVHLAAVAHRRGYDAVHVVHRGLRGWKDWDLLRIVEAEDRVLVTNNAFEFRARYALRDVHPGIVFIIPSVPRTAQIELFSAALDDIDRDPDLVNTGLDVAFSADSIEVRRHRIP